MAVVVREGGESDFPALIGLIRELAEFENSLDRVRNSVEQMQREKGSFRFFVAEVNGSIIGAAVYFFAYYTWVGKSLYLDDLYVKPEHRRKTVGTALMRQVFQVASREGCKRLRLQVLDWNKNAISFYKKHGGEISGEWLNCDFDESGIERLLETTAPQAARRPRG